MKVLSSLLFYPFRNFITFIRAQTLFLVIYVKIAKQPFEMYSVNKILFFLPEFTNNHLFWQNIDQGRMYSAHTHACSFLSSRDVIYFFLL